ncbi:MAG TPA: GNAT family N-acetyltransferase [Gaiellaceae bacterium]|nr:GNAT family N-acetyltransferase [Gaiellaceae bacterium]
MIELRPPTLDDLPEITTFFGELEAAGGAGATEGEIRDWLTSPTFDIEADFRLALDADRIVGWCDVWDQNKAHERFFLDVRGNPTPEVYGVLLDWGLERARAMAGSSAVCRAWGNAADEVFEEAVRERGFRLIRHFFRMEIGLDAEPAPPVWPEGMTVRTVEPGETRAVYDAITDAFADHWDFVPTAFEEWEHLFVRSSEFDPTLWFLAVEGDEIAGLSLCRSERRPGVGHVGVLGVRPAWRRQGLGTALLLHSFHELRARGRPRADLGVDGENTTGAVRLYERAGMSVVRRSDSYEKELT